MRYVRTEHGYVVADPTARSGRSPTPASGADRAASMPKHPRLVATTRRPLAGWVDPSGDAPAFVVLDQGTGDVDAVRRGDRRRTWATLADEENPAYFYAIDGHTAYWRDARGAVAVDLDDRRRAGGRARAPGTASTSSPSRTT